MADDEDLLAEIAHLTKEVARARDLLQRAVFFPAKASRAGRPWSANEARAADDLAAVIAGTETDGDSPESGRGQT